MSKSYEKKKKKKAIYEGLSATAIGGTYGGLIGHDLGATTGIIPASKVYKDIRDKEKVDSATKERAENTIDPKNRREKIIKINKEFGKELRGDREKYVNDMVNKAVEEVKRKRKVKGVDEATKKILTRGAKIAHKKDMLTRLRVATHRRMRNLRTEKINTSDIGKLWNSSSKASEAEAKVLRRYKIGGAVIGAAAVGLPLGYAVYKAGMKYKPRGNKKRIRASGNK